MSPRGHARLGASKADIWLNCPGQPRLAATLPDPPPTAYAAEGTLAHALAEHCLNVGIHPSQVPELDGQSIAQEMTWHVAVYTDYVRQRCLELGAGAIGATAFLAVETPVDLTWLHPDCWGTLDAVIYQPFGRAVVVDLKYGAGVPVEVDDNPQLAFYALAPFHDYDCTEVEVVIVQPRCHHEAGPIRSRTYTHAELQQWAERFRAGAVACDAPDAPLTPGKHCDKWCKAAAICPALRERALASAQAEFGAVPPAPASLSPQQLADVLAKASLISAWADAVRAFAYDQALKGSPPPGYKLVAGRKGPRKWNDEAAAVEALQQRHVDPWERTVISPARAEKELGKVAAKDLEPLIVQAPGRVELVPEGDKRPAVSAGPQADFATPDYGF